MRQAWLRLLITIGVGFFLAGCGHHQRTAGLPVPVSRPGLPASVTPVPSGPSYQSGSLVNLESGDDEFVRIFSSRRARRVNDLVYVLVSENFEGTGKAATSSDGSNSSKYSVPGLFALKKYLGDLGQMDDWLETERSTKTSGTGATSRSNTLTAKIAARVTEILPNGDFRILGTHFTKVNHEDHYVTVSGVIRPTDISADNYILSSAIAEARIEYSGTGSLAGKQTVGWGTKILDAVWPF